MKNLTQREASEVLVALYAHRDEVLKAMDQPELIRDKQIEALNYLSKKEDYEGMRLVSEAFDLLEHAIIGRKSADDMTARIDKLQQTLGK